MTNWLNHLIVKVQDAILGLFRIRWIDTPLVHSLHALGALQPAFEKYSRRKAFEVYRHARMKCPGYRKFLEMNGVPALKSFSDFRLVPCTDKENYIKKFSVEERCIGGEIPRTGVVIDESSGSSGIPNNWVRGPEERRAVKRLIQHSYQLRYGKAALMVLNCFALGPWATGMNVSMALVDLAILKSIGPDKAKLDASLKLFGPRYRYVLAGYPPFFKDWLASTTLDLTALELHLIVGGEGISEGLRDFFLTHCKSVCSSYGASDLEINIGAETAFTIALRKLCLKSPPLCRALFGRDDAPMIFQYNPLHYFIERSEDGELLTTVLRFNNASPRVRYNIKDLGGTISFRAAKRLIEASGIAAGEFFKGAVGLPLLYVFGRSDLSVPFYGAKVFSTDLDQIVNGSDELRRVFKSFQISVFEQDSLEKTLVIDLEEAEGHSLPLSNRELANLFFSRLQEVNQDFREVSKLFGAERLEIRRHQANCGPFRGRDLRQKNKYIS